MQSHCVGLFLGQLTQQVGLDLSGAGARLLDHDIASGKNNP
jgi:hypothetical protein